VVVAPEGNGQFFFSPNTQNTLETSFCIRSNGMFSLFRTSGVQKSSFFREGLGAHFWAFWPVLYRKTLKPPLPERKKKKMFSKKRFFSKILFADSF
jgi:hypothetical protein